MSAETAGWFYDFNNERKGPFSTEQVSALLTAGVITEHTKVWSEALAEWTPLFRTELRALLGERPISPPDIIDTRPASSAPADLTVARPSAPSRSYPIYDNRMLAKILRWAMLVCGAISLLSMWLIFKEKTPEQQYLAAKIQESEQWLFIFLIPLFATFALFLTWKYRATANLFTLKGQQTVTPAGAVYWYFVPVACFWKPYEAMRNLWNGAGMDKRQPYEIESWWLMFWLPFAISILWGLFQSGEITEVSEARTYAIWSMVISAVDAVYFLATAELIKRMSAAESQRLATAMPA